MNTGLITISEAAKMLQVSINTLRRWDKSGRFPAIRKKKGGYRYYSKKGIEIYLLELFGIARKWASDKKAIEPSKDFYNPNSSFFNGRLDTLGTYLSQINDKELNKIFPLITLITGEIGHNSFDHNLGNWPDMPGIFFGYDLLKRYIVLADRGQGVLATLKKVRPSLNNHEDALRVAFTEFVSGRAPENRGQGLKSVRDIVTSNPISLFFQTGNAQLNIKKNDFNLNIELSDIYIHGCIALIRF